MEWVDLSKAEPTETGRYLVGHGGHAEVIHFLADDRDWVQTAKTGWRKDPRSFGATHWVILPDMPKRGGSRKMLAQLPRGAVVYMARDCYANKRRYRTYETFVPKKFCGLTFRSGRRCRPTTARQYLWRREHVGSFCGKISTKVPTLTMF